MDKMMKNALFTATLLSTFAFVACSENLDSEHHSPVLDQGQTTHRPGDSSGGNQENPSNPGENAGNEDNKGNTGDDSGKGDDGKGDKDDSDITINPGSPNPGDGDDGKDDNPGVTPGNPGQDDDPKDDPKPSLPDKDPSIPDGSAVEQEFVDVDGESLPVPQLTYAPYTTLQRRHKPIIGTSRYDVNRVKELIRVGELKATDKEKYEKYGMGTTYIEGLPWIVRNNLLRVSDPQFSHKGKSLAYFWQVSDPQIIDAQSPCRMEAVITAPYVVSSAYRASGIYSTHMFDMHVQTARRISDHSSRPFDFALVTGDVADNAQENEFGWFERMMTGGRLDPDSGKRDDPVPGPNNDFTDPYYSKGLGDIPWYIAIGNHDMLYMGFTVITDAIREACVGDTVVDLFADMPVASAQYRNGYNNGFQDASTRDSVVRGFGEKTTADPHRRPLTKIESLQKFYNIGGNPAGHGLDLDTVAKGWGYYTAYPIPGKPLKLITLDTNSGTFSEADMSVEQFNWLKIELDKAKENHELVIMQSHHGTPHMSGEVNARAFQQLVSSYSNVILHITGHGHNNDSNVWINNSKGYWEVMLASVVDFPSQSRIFEIVHEGNGIIAIYITNIEPNAPRNSFVDLGVQYAAARLFFGMSKDPIADWEGENAHTNLVLRTRVPQDVYENLEKYEWSSTIESEELLNKLEFKE